METNLTDRDYRQDAGQPFDIATDDSLSVQPEKEPPRHR